MSKMLKKAAKVAVIAICIGLLSSNVHADSLLKQGSRGNEVIMLQNKLRSISYADFNATGYYGVLTREAVRNYQRNNGLVPDGIAGYWTLMKLGIANVNSYLQYGSRGSAVVKLQNALNSKGFSAGKMDGIFGVRTLNAVISFQKANGLTPDGIAGAITQTKLYSMSASATTSSRGNSTAEITSNDLYWMSRIIYAEAGAEPYIGKVAVGNVIMNRVNSSEFPNTVKGVIFEYYEGIPQFSPVADGTIYNNPDADSIKAAKEALSGLKPVGISTYFFNPDKASGYWIINNKTYVTRIGNHVFYK
jgi:N-acetylmuramoyl-L-alanine amidase